jgi:hypothetical protein
MTTHTEASCVFAKSTKVLIAALVLASTSLAVVADASPRRAAGHSAVHARSIPVVWQTGVDTTRPERHDPTNTNGG